MSSVIVKQRLPTSTTSIGSKTTAMPENTSSSPEPNEMAPVIISEIVSQQQQQHDPSPMNEGGFSPHSTTGGPSKTSPEPEQERPALEQANPLKQVLATVYRLAASVSRQHSERILQIITDLLIGSLEADEFQQRVAEVLRLPFRPLVGAMLDQQLTPIRKEMASRLHALRQTNQQSGVVKEVRHLIGIDQHQHDAPHQQPPLGYWQVFEPDADESATGRKRRASASLAETEESSASKRPNWRTEPSPSLWIPPRAYHSPPQTQQQTKPASPPFRVQQQGDEEWANIHTMLNCILSMVEKTRRALGILQQRANDNQYHYKRRDPQYAPPSHHHAYEASELRRHAGELIAQTLKATEDRVTQVKRKAEEAVHDVRRAAMAELQRALSAERLRAERLAAEARRQGAEEALLALGRFGANKEVCWNCGRRASETCSGCNVARYCSTFCQHKHWEVHHKICGRSNHLSPVLEANPITRENLASSSSPSASGSSPKPASPMETPGQAV